MARLGKNLPQSAVTGGFITRNMLSQIESGTALPSIATLEYLCRKLEIPASELLSGLSELSEPSGLSEKEGFPDSELGKPFTVATDEEIRESFRQARLVGKLTEAKREFTAGDFIKAAVLAERHGTDELLAE